MNSLFNYFLEAVLRQIPVDLSVENSHLKYLALQKDQEILRLKADFQRDKDDFDTQASNIFDLERDIATARDDIRVKERQLASLNGQINTREERIALLRQELNRLTSSLEVSRKQNESLEEKVKVKTTEAESTYAELLKLRASLATVEKKAADDFKDAQRENERQSSQVTMLRKNLDRSRLEERARDDTVTELKNQLKEAGDERRMKENEIQASASRQAELESRLSKQIEDAKGLERELTDTKGKLVQLAILSQKRGLELVSTQKQLDGMRSEITKVKDYAAELNIEMLDLKLQLRDSNEKCSMLEGKVRRGETEAQVLEKRIGTLQSEHREMQEMVFTRGRGLEESKKALEAASEEHHKLQNLLDDANDDVYQKTETVTFLSSSLQHSQNVVEELKKQKEVLEQQSAERQATMKRQRDESKRMLDSTGAERDQLRNLLEDARSDISQKSETIFSLTSSLQHAQSIVKDMETQREALVGQSSEMDETMKNQMEEIEKNKQELAELMKSYQTVTEQLGLETKRTKDKDDELSEAVVRLKMANSTLAEREQALSVALGDLEQKEIELRGSLSDSRNELSVRDSSLAKLQQEFNSLSSNLKGLHHQNSSLEETIKLKTVKAESVYAELQKITRLLAIAEKKAADDLQAAQGEIKGQSTQVTALRQDLDRLRLEGRSKDDEVKELKNQLKKGEDERGRRDMELQTLTSRQTEDLNRQLEHVKALERELTDTKGRLTQLTAVSENRELELVRMHKESDGMRDGITKLRQELSSLKNDHGSIEQSLRTAEENATSLTGEVLRLRLQVRDLHEKRSELEETMKQDAAEAQLLKQRNETLQRLYEETQAMVFTRGHDLEKTKKSLESTTAQRYELQSVLDDARNDVMQKTETISSLSSSLRGLKCVVEELEKQKEVLEQRSAEMQETMEKQKDESKGTTAERDKLQSLLDEARSEIAKKLETIGSLTSSLQHSQNVTKEMETERTTLIGQSSEMQETAKKQAEEIRKIEGDLAQLKKSYETVTEQLGLEMERTKDKDVRLSEAAVRLQTANFTLEEREQALSVAHGDFERKDKEINHLRSSLSASHSELNARDSSMATLRQKFNTLSSDLEGLRHQNSSLEEMIKIKTAEAESSYAELQKSTSLLARAEKKAMDELHDARREVKEQASQTTALRQELERVRSEERAKENAVQALENLLKEALDVQRRKEEELRASVSRQTELETRLNKQSEEAKELEGELMNTKDRLSQVMVLLDTRESELLSMRKELDSMREGIALLLHGGTRTRTPESFGGQKG